MNIAKLNTASLDDKTFIIKRGTSGGGTPDTPSDDGWEYYKFDGEAFENTIKGMGISNGEEIKNALIEIFPFFIYGHGIVVNTSRINPETNLTFFSLPAEESMPSAIKGFKQMVAEEALLGSVFAGISSVEGLLEKSGQLIPDYKPFFAFLTPCTKEEFEALITQ